MSAEVFTEVVKCMVPTCDRFGTHIVNVHGVKLRPRCGPHARRTAGRLQAAPAA